MIEELVAEIRQEKQYADDYNGLVVRRMDQSLSHRSAQGLTEDLAIDRLVQSAGIFSLSENSRARREAFTIATAAFELYGEALGGLADVLQLVMSRLGHFPSLDFRTELTARRSNLPTPALLETTAHRVANTLTTEAGELALTDYQRTIWADLLLQRSIIASAPTSAGKSFMFQTYLAHQLKGGAIKAAAFLVPTRALISQVAASLTKQLEAFGDEATRIATVPVVQDQSRPTIYVMTQERLQVLLADAEFSVETIVIDEAHQIGEGHRGVILQSVVDELLARAPSTQLLFTLPRVTNPEELARVFSVSELSVRKTNDSPVGQNIILTDVSDAIPDEVRTKIWDEQAMAEFVNFNVSMPLFQADQKLVYLAWYFGRGSQSIIYGDTRARCEGLSSLLRDVIAEADPDRVVSPSIEEKRAELAKFAKEHVHPEFLLAKHVMSGVGFHYGHIPTLIRHAIEAAFEDGTLDFIVCTSTLLQGVNLPARNIFIRNPEKGEKPMDAVDFWNLAGRAGRLGKEFEGNVFLIDYNEWESQPLAHGPEGEVRSSLQKQLVEHTDEFLAYIADPTVASGKNTLLENVFSRLFHDLRRGTLDQTLQRMQVPAKKRAALVEGLEEANNQVSVPTETLAATPYISPHRQQKLYAKLKRDIPKNGVGYYMPPHPAGDWKTVQSKLINVYRRLQVELDGVTKGESYIRWATLSLSWMRGDGLPNLIQFEIDRDIKRVEDGRANGGRQRRSDTAVIIRKILEDVEKTLRFKFVKQMACYNAVLRQVLLELGHDREAGHIPAIPLFLEMGASSETMLSFIDLGLSRISARLLQMRAANFAMDRDAALAWLHRQNFGLELPDVVRRELAPLLR